MSARATVALYGLGNMGLLLAERLARRFRLQAADLDAERVRRAVEELEAEAVGVPEQLADTAFVVLCLPSPTASRAVLTRLAPHLRKDCVVVETGTVNPDDVLAARAILAPFEIDLVDASIMAGVSQMKAGTAMLLLGGTPEALDRCEPVLDAIAERRIVFGGPGAGAAAKVINNAVAHAVMVVVAEAGSMATAAGVDIDKLVALLADKEMGLHRPLTHRYTERIMRDDYDGGMPLAAARKDSALALALAQSYGVPLFAIQAVHTVYEIAAASGYEREDYAALAKLWAGWGRPASRFPS
jgi:3-hydroxyisobutyrate dehydrogenase-like beta-hydroxyacid dehydrogenase